MTTDEKVDDKTDAVRTGVFDALTNELELARHAPRARRRSVDSRVSRDAWVDTFTHLRDKHGCKWFDFFSAIDWLPSPFGRSMDSEIDTIVHGKDVKEPEPWPPAWRVAKPASRCSPASTT